MIYFAQEGWKSRIINKLKDWKKSFNNQMAASAIIEAPAVMTAAGQKINRNGQVEYNHTDDSGVKQLRLNLQTIGEAAVAAPTLAGDVEATYQIVRHPVQTAKAVVKAGKEAVNAGKHLLQKENVTPTTIIGDNEPLILWKNNKSQGQYTQKDLYKLYLKQKQDLYKYIESQDFKNRIVKANERLETLKKEPINYNKLISEIKNRLSNTKYDENLVMPSNWGGVNKHDMINRQKYHTIKVSGDYNETQTDANIWHELWHSVAGDPAPEFNYPEFSKLKYYNEDLGAKQLHGSKQLFSTPGERYRRLKDYVKEDKIGEYLNKEFKRELFLYKNVFQRPHEVRSRMQATLRWLRNNGYDTTQLVHKPEKFITWINELMDKEVQAPWDVNHLLGSFDIRDLADYAGKVMTTSGVTYTGIKLSNK